MNCGKEEAEFPAAWFDPHVRGFVQDTGISGKSSKLWIATRAIADDLILIVGELCKKLPLVIFIYLYQWVNHVEKTGKVYVTCVDR